MRENIKSLYCGVDLGGTTVNVGMVTPDGDVVSEQRIPSRVEAGVDSVVTHIADAVKVCQKMAGQGLSTIGIGIGVAGLVDVKNGILREATNFPGWFDVPLASNLADALNLPVSMDNDANVAALGEYTFGAGKSFDHMLMVTLGTGVGSGLVLDGKIYRGAYDAAGEFGHITIQKDGPRCACGRAGCVEAFVGTRGILRQVKELLTQYPASSLAQYDLQSITPKDIYRHAHAGDEMAKLVFRQVGENLGYGLGNVVNLLNIQRIVVGGGVAAAGDYIIKSAQLVLDDFSLNNSAEPVKIVNAELGVNAGIVGAASLAMTAA